MKSVIDSIDKQKEMIEKLQELVTEITDAMNELVNGVEYEDDFYKMVNWLLPCGICLNATPSLTEKLQGY